MKLDGQRGGEGLGELGKWKEHNQMSNILHKNLNKTSLKNGIPRFRIHTGHWLSGCYFQSLL